MKDFKGKIVFVSGGASGAGLGQAKVFGRAPPLQGLPEPDGRGHLRHLRLHEAGQIEDLRGIRPPGM